MVDSFEKIAVQIYANATEGSKHVANEIAHLIRQKQALNEPCVLGLATGSTPISLYAELVRQHREEGLSFNNVISFNLDEYYPIERDAYQSYWSFMHRHLFNHINILPENINLPEGIGTKDDVKRLCAEYENKIELAGGIDLQVLGLGNNGHIGFNEPGSSIFSKTRMVNLENGTRLSNTYEFQNISKVPRRAVTMGISTILKSKRILLMAWGPKTGIVAKAVEGLSLIHI